MPFDISASWLSVVPIAIVVLMIVYALRVLREYERPVVFMLPAQIAGLAFVFVCAWLLGAREERRLGTPSGPNRDGVERQEIGGEQLALRRPERVWINLTLTVLLIAGMIAFKLEPAVVFMAGLVVNLESESHAREIADATAASRAALPWNVGMPEHNPLGQL